MEFSRTCAQRRQRDGDPKAAAARLATPLPLRQAPAAAAGAAALARRGLLGGCVGEFWARHARDPGRWRGRRRQPAAAYLLVPNREIVWRRVQESLVFVPRPAEAELVRLPRIMYILADRERARQRRGLQRQRPLLTRRQAPGGRRELPATSHVLAASSSVAAGCRWGASLVLGVGEVTSIFTLPRGQVPQVLERQPRVPAALPAGGVGFQTLDEHACVAVEAEVPQRALEHGEGQRVAPGCVQHPEGAQDGPEGDLGPRLEVRQRIRRVLVDLAQRDEAAGVLVEGAPDPWDVLEAQQPARVAELLVRGAVRVVTVQQPPPRDDEVRVAAPQGGDQAFLLLVVGVRAEPGRRLPFVEEGDVLRRDHAHVVHVERLVQHRRGLLRGDAGSAREVGDAQGDGEVVDVPLCEPSARHRGELLERRHAAAVLLAGPLFETRKDERHPHVHLLEVHGAVVVYIHCLPQRHDVAAERDLPAALQHLNFRDREVPVEVEDPAPAADEGAAAGRADLLAELLERGLLQSAL